MCFVILFKLVITLLYNLTHAKDYFVYFIVVVENKQIKHKNTRKTDLIAKQI